MLRDYFQVEERDLAERSWRRKSKRGLGARRPRVSIRSLAVSLCLGDPPAFPEGRSQMGRRRRRGTQSGKKWGY